jgi:peptidoglycan/xylan/chitin deacetylase (PgdA/CDA1 family)
MGVHDQFARTSDAIERASGVAPTLWRPPYGYTNPRVDRIARAMGLRLALWNLDSEDYADVDRPGRVARRVLRRVHDGSVILLHDGHTEPHDDPTGYLALRIIMPRLVARGYCFSTLPLEPKPLGCRARVALTFDDGPNAVVTPRILALLRRHRARATFFVVGVKAEKHPELVRREVAEDHVVANHSFDHPDLPALARGDVERAFREVQ